MPTKGALYTELSELIGQKVDGSSTPVNGRATGPLEELLATLQTRNGNTEKFQTAQQRPSPKNAGNPRYEEKEKLAGYITEVTGVEIPWSATTPYKVLDAFADYLIK